MPTTRRSSGPSPGPPPGPSPGAYPLAVSTLGLPGATLADVVRTAVDGGCQGVELRAAADHVVHTGSSAARRVEIRQAFADAGLALVTLASYVRVAAPGPDQPVLDELRAHVQLAQELGAPAIRVFPGGDPDDVDGSDRRAAARLAAARTGAADAGVRLLLETHDSHPRGTDLARILPDTGAGAIWDLAHPWRHGEELATTWEALRAWLVEVQVKDMQSREDHLPVLPGDGVLPLAELADLLAGPAADAFTEPATGSSLWISLEWEKTWHPDAAPVAEALTATRGWLDALNTRVAARRCPDGRS